MTHQWRLRIGICLRGGSGKGVRGRGRGRGREGKGKGGREGEGEFFSFGQLVFFSFPPQRYFPFSFLLLTSTRHSSTSLSLKPRRAERARDGDAAGVARAPAASSPGDDAMTSFFSFSGIF